MSGGKMANHGSNPRSQRLARDGRQRMDREARLSARRTAREAPRPPTTLKHCPVCGKGLTSRYRSPGEMHLRRGCSCVCRWTP